MFELRDSTGCTIEQASNYIRYGIALPKPKKIVTIEAKDLEVDLDDLLLTINKCKSLIVRGIQEDISNRINELTPTEIATYASTLVGIEKSLEGKVGATKTLREELNDKYGDRISISASVLTTAKPTIGYNDDC